MLFSYAASIKNINCKNSILNSMLFNICRKTFCLFLSLKTHFLLWHGSSEKGWKANVFYPKFCKARCQKRSMILHPPFIFIIHVTHVHQCCKKENLTFQVDTATEQPQWFYNTVKLTFNKTFMTLKGIATLSPCFHGVYQKNIFSELLFEH